MHFVPPEMFPLSRDVPPLSLKEWLYDFRWAGAKKINKKGYKNLQTDIKEWLRSFYHTRYVNKNVKKVQKYY